MNKPEGKKPQFAATYTFQSPPLKTQVFETPSNLKWFALKLSRRQTFNEMRVKAGIQELLKDFLRSILNLMRILVRLIETI